MGTASRVRPCVALALALLVGACGDGPTAPGMPAESGLDLAGSWSGTWTYTTAGVTVTDDVTATLNRSGGNVTGAWQATSGSTGRLDFGAAAAVSGTITINQALLGGSSCNASTAIRGTADAAHIDVTLTDIAPQGVCQWGTGGRMVLTR